MKWSYKECDVEITASRHPFVRALLTPTVEIRCNGAVDPHVLMSQETFASDIEAELHGVTMAKEWIDENVK